MSSSSSFPTKYSAFSKPDATSNSSALNADSTTMEFRKYLDDLKKSYLEKLTFSCPSKPTNTATTTTITTTNNNKANNQSQNQQRLKSVENINNLLTKNLTNTASNARKSLFTENSVQAKEVVEFEVVSIIFI